MASLKSAMDSDSEDSEGEYRLTGNIIEEVDTDEDDSMETDAETVPELLWQYRHHGQPRVDAITGKEFEIRLQRNEKGLGYKNRGAGLVSKQHVPAGDLFLVSESPGKKFSTSAEKTEYVDSGNYMVGANGFDNMEMVMKVNTINPLSSKKFEKPNVSLRVLCKAKLKENFRVKVKLNGMYAIIVAIADIDIGDFLLLEHYGKGSDLKYGTPQFLKVQVSVMKEYEKAHEIVKSKKFPGSFVCPTCFERRSSVLNKKGNLHNLQCKKNVMKLALQKAGLLKEKATPEEENS